MGILDDAASVISARTSHSKRSKSHRSSRHSHHHRSKSRSRSRSRHRSSRSTVGGDGGVANTIRGVAASIFGAGEDDDDDLDYGYHRHRRSHHHDRRGDDDDGARSFFSLPNPSRSSFFSNFGRPHGSSSSYYKRSPRPGFTARLLRKLKRLLRDLLYYAKRHPVRVFMLVLMPLVTGGALTALLARFGLRLPPFLERMLGVAARAAGAGAAGDSLGLVGEAVRMVSGAAGAGAGSARASVERGRDGGLRWERRSLERDYDIPYGGGRGGGGYGWEDGLKGIAKVFS
ncbi:hypothetical protein C7999DRAFT_31376 [Corynascus novoguineensis]|uniref:Uncharacterized protein n=1 Tax=Corynascus novoguineensis TaxID=1126955 RepID=A0AAN7CVU3_9PEZI|nr:hypothetical protein C7999DRAFT_31376 [Corynascus novoguineensis]